MLISWLKDARKAQGLTMRELAQKLEVPHSFIGKVEQCERRIDVIEYIKYCQALNINPNDGIQLLTS
jgi:transcriptional regulator with XRE-family HTH domain